MSGRSLALTLVAGLFALSSCSTERALERSEFTRIQMGVRTRIVLYAPDEESAERAAARAFARIDELDGELSSYRLESELSRVEANAAAQPLAVGPDLLFILKRAQEISAASEGVFDVTIAPLVALWRASQSSGELPTATALAAARADVGWRAVEIDDARSTVRLARAGIELDLGGIAKGYAASEAVDELRAAGIARCLVALAGDIAVGDPPPESAGWAIAISPSAEIALAGVLSLSNAAVSTSGDAEQHVEIGGRRFSHIVDPRTGVGLESRRAVAVVAPRGEDADALSTAACLLGPDEAHALFRGHPRTAAVFAEPESSGTELLIFDPDLVLRWKEAPPSSVVIP